MLESKSYSLLLWSRVSRFLNIRDKKVVRALGVMEIFHLFIGMLYALSKLMEMVSFIEYKLYLKRVVFFKAGREFVENLVFVTKATLHT